MRHALVVRSPLTRQLSITIAEDGLPPVGQVPLRSAKIALAPRIGLRMLREITEFRKNPVALGALTFC